MCGIFGIVRSSGLTPIDHWSVRHLADAMVHRGPDGEGFHVTDHAAIGMRRLAIIDPSTGWQPLYSEDQSVVVVANGEIYNHVELRDELIRRGHSFRTGSDCETIVHLYEEHGDDCVRHLRGMFAFAVLDLRRGRLLLVRDRMGEKPLYLVERDGFLAFCSELIGLCGAGVVPPELDLGAIRDYYFWGFIPEPLCPFQGVRKLPAGERLTIDLRSGARSQSRYWRLSDAPAISGDPVEVIREELGLMSRIVMRSDKPLAVGLSAGIDSSAIAMFAKRFASQETACISIGYEGRAFQDESWLAADFAREHGLRHHRVELTTEQVVREFRTVCLRRDEPNSDPAGSSIYALAAASRDLGYPVLFSGLGGDELFWGYAWHRKCVASNERLRRLRAGEASWFEYLSMGKPPLSWVGLLQWLQDGGGLVSELRQRGSDMVLPPDQLRFWDMTPEYRQARAALDGILGPAFRSTDSDPARHFRGAEFWGNVGVSLTDLICATYLRSNGLGQTDRLSMACSVESRVPFADARLAEVVVGLRKSCPDHRLPRKQWLRSALKGIVPDDVMRRRKRGFTPPWRRWTSALMLAFGDQLAHGALVDLGLLDRDAAVRLRRGIDRLGRPVPLALPTLVLELWVSGMRSVCSAAPQPGELPPMLPRSPYWQPGGSAPPKPH
jgi:asparagine synthase (glutamine-hydrolysing)